MILLIQRLTNFICGFLLTIKLSLNTKKTKYIVTRFKHNSSTFVNKYILINGILLNRLENDSVESSIMNKV